MSTTPIYGLLEWAGPQAQPWVGHDSALRLIEALIRGSVADRDLAAPPLACADGAAYLVAAPAAGAWAGHAGKLAVAVGQDASNGWLFAVIATTGKLLWVDDEAIRLEFDGASWIEFVAGDGGGGGDPDPHWAEVVFLAGFEDVTPTDESSLAQAVTRYTNDGPDVLTAPYPTCIDTVAKYGAQSLQMPAEFDWAGIGVPADAAMNLGASPFTMEAFVRFPVAPPASSVLFGQYNDGDGSNVWRLLLTYWSGGGMFGLRFEAQDAPGGGYSNIDNVNSGNVVPFALDTWFHCALDFDGTKYRIYVDGAMVGSEAAWAWPIAASTSPLTVGCDLAGAGPFPNNPLFGAQMDEARITVGTARYASDAGFTPPAAAFPRS